MDEGCVSVPHLCDEIIRPESIILKFQDLNIHLLEYANAGS